MKPSKKKKIAFITSGYFPVPPTKGGAVESLVFVLIQQNELHSKFDFTAFSSFDEQAERVSSENSQHTSYKYIRSPKVIKLIDNIIFFVFTKIFRKAKSMSYRYILQRIWYLFLVGIDLAKSNYDYLIFENSPINFWALKLFGNEKKYARRYGYHLHNEVPGTYGCGKLIENADLIIGISEFINKKFKMKFVNYSNGITKLTNCAVNSEKNINLNVRKELKLSKNDFLVLFAGRLSPEKGILELIEAFSEIDSNSITLMVVGSYYYKSKIVSEFESELRKAASSVKSRIRFIGYVDHEKMGAYYDAADLAVFPAMWDEPAGLTVIEAMAHALPVITTNSGGIPEYVGNDNVIIVQRDEKISSRIAESIVYLERHKEVRDALGKRAKKRSNLFTQEKYFKDFTSLMEAK